MSVGEMRELDPYESAMTFFGAEVRRLRMAAGMSMAELGKRLYSTKSMVAMVERADRMPSLDFAKFCDKVFETGDQFTRLWPLVNRSVYPKWFRPYVDLEEAATIIRTYQVQAVHGLLQTEEYARAILKAGRPKDLDGMVRARINRQQILKREDPPRLWMVLDEAALSRCIGSVEVMKGQLARLIEAAALPNVVIQILPFSVGVHGAFNGSLTVMRFAEGSDIAYSEGYGPGELIGQREEVSLCQESYDLVRADALSPQASADLIASLLEEPNSWATPYRS